MGVFLGNDMKIQFFNSCGGKDKRAIQTIELIKLSSDQRPYRI